MRLVESRFDMILLKHLSLSCVILFVVGYSNPDVTEQELIPDDTLITLERSICFGSCPDYKLTVAADGTVTFEGRQFVKTKGVAKGTISRKDLRNLIAAFDAAAYFSLHDKYATQEDGCPEVWTDNPSVITSIQINHKTKSISHYYGCQVGGGTSIYPNGLTYLETKIDQIVGTDKWIK
jgi:hypothetical protein